jgi:hypothetical protein
MDECSERYLYALLRRRAKFAYLIRDLFLDNGALEVLARSRGRVLTMVYAHDAPCQLMFCVTRLCRGKSLVMRELIDRHIGHEFEVGIDQGIRNRQHLAVHLLRRFRKANIVIERFRHLLHPICPHQKRQGHTDLRGLPIGLLYLSAHEEVELLVRSP